MNLGSLDREEVNTMDRVVAFRVSPESFDALDRARRLAGENWKVFTLKAFRSLLQGEPVTEVLERELEEVVKVRVKVVEEEPTKKTPAKESKKAKAKKGGRASSK
jgi:hypothetical protein